MSVGKRVISREGAKNTGGRCEGHPRFRDVSWLFAAIIHRAEEFTHRRRGLEEDEVDTKRLARFRSFAIRATRAMV